MLSERTIREKTADLESTYINFMVHHFDGWRQWADASQRMADGQQVTAAELPEAFITEYKMMAAVLEMEAAGKFDWANPTLRAAFAEAAASPFYKLWGDMITKIALRLAALAGVKTLVEIGAGRGNLTSIMLTQITEARAAVSLIVTDANPVVLEHVAALSTNFPAIRLETMLWNITEPLPDQVLARIERPCLVYERSSILYATIPAISNIAQAADIAVFGDWFNNTGRLYAYDEVFKRIGAQPLLYRDVQPQLEKHFKEHFLFDTRAQQQIDLPNSTMLIAWK
jgi:hypothetical protein